MYLPRKHSIFQHNLWFRKVITMAADPLGGLASPPKPQADLHTAYCVQRPLAFARNSINV